MSRSPWLAEVYSNHGRQLYLAAWTVIRRKDLAEDAVHTAFARLARIAEPPRDPKLYALRAVRNAAIDMLSAEARRREQSLDSDSEPEVPTGENDNARLLIELARAIERLDPASREIIELHLQASLTFQEIADMADEPLSTVASRYRRALTKLRQQIEVCNG